MSIPDVRVEVAFGSQPGDAVQSWTDVTSYVDLSAPVSITRGRGDEFSRVQPSTCSLVLDNSDGRFTAGLSSSPYYPNVKIGRQVRITSGDPANRNFLADETASFEGGTVGDWAAFFGAPTLSNSTTRAWSGSQSMQVVFETVGQYFSISATTVSDLVAGRTYTFSLYVYVPSSGGCPITIDADNKTGSTVTSSTTGAWQRISLQFVPASTTSRLYIANGAAATAGQKAWVDAVMVNEGSTAATFTLGAPAARFTGYVDEWPTTFAPTGQYASATVTATDRLKRLGQIAEFTNAPAQEILYDSPSAYYMLGEDSDSTTAGDVSGFGRTSLAVAQVGSGGTLEFATGTGPGTDALSAPTFTPSTTANGKYLTAVVDELSGSSAVSTVRASFNTSTSATQTIVRVSNESSFFTTAIEMRVTSAGKLQASSSWAEIAAEVTVTSSASVADGHTHDGEVTWDGTTLELWLDGVSQGTVAGGSTVGTSIRRLSVGGYSGGQCFTGVIAHVAVFPAVLADDRIQEQANMILDGGSGETSDERISRYARWAGVSTAEQDLEAGASTAIAHRDTTGLAPLTAMQDIATTEGGLLFIAGNGSLTFHARSHRYNTASSLTLTEIGVSDTFVVNDQLLANDITASRDGGITYRAVNQDSIDDYGPYRQQLTLLTTSDNEVADAAQWQAYTRSQPEPRLSSLTIDLLTDTSIRDAALALEIGDRVTLPTLPDQAPDSASDVFIEGWTESISASAWSLVCNTSPAAWSGVWALDSSVYSVLGTSTRLAY